MAGEIKKLEEFCKKFGGRLLKVKKSQYRWLRENSSGFGNRTFFESPGTPNDLGIHWPSRTIVYAGEVLWSEVIHEMGHTFTQEDNPTDVDEGEFIGWEYLLAQQVGDVQEWLCESESFSVGDRELGDLTPEEQVEYFEDSIKIGQKNGIIDGNRKLRAFKREFKFEAAKDYFGTFLEIERSRGAAALRMPMVTGENMEHRFKSEGFAKGYERAMYDVFEYLDSSFVTPLPPLGKR